MQKPSCQEHLGMMGKHPGSFRGWILGMGSGFLWGGGRQPLPAAPSPDRKQAWDREQALASWGCLGNTPGKVRGKGANSPLFSLSYACACRRVTSWPAPTFPVKTTPLLLSTGHVDALFLKTPVGAHSFILIHRYSLICNF